MLFESIPPRPALSRTVLLERFAADARAEKLLLASGAYKDESGRTPLLESIRIATERVNSRGISRDYLPGAGDPKFIAAIESLLLGELNVTAGKRMRTAHTPGGTAAIWVGAMLIKAVAPGARVWISDPTWGNHIKVFEQAGLEVVAHPYYDASSRTLIFDDMLAAVERIPAGDVLFLQGATHNPTGLDPDPAQWKQLKEGVRRRRIFPFFDLAFFGFSNGLREDLQGLLQFLADGEELLVATSLSKSMSFYNERVGSLSIVGATEAGAAAAFSHVEHLIRGSYSNPPLHGAAIAAEVLSDGELFAFWEKDLAAIRARIRTMRERFALGLSARVPLRDFSYVERERGLFTKFDVAEGAVDHLRERYALHLGAGGRCNITAVPEARFENVCDLIAACIPLTNGP
ncbi:MAG: aromatic amino acid transaminase [Planctomycetaceae bacterium]